MSEQDLSAPNTDSEQSEVAKEAVADEEQPQVVSRLLRSDEIDAPNISTWQLSSFAEEKQAKEEELSQKAYEKFHDEYEPKFQQQAEILKKEAYDQAFQKGYEEGLENGLAEGRQKGEAEAKQQVMDNLLPKVDQFEELLTSIKKPYQVIEEKVYSELVDFALHIAKTVIHKSVDEHKHWVLQAVKDAVLVLPESEGKIEVFLHPDDLAFLQISKPSISENWVLRENHQLQQGTCLVKQDYSTVMNSWISRFDEVVEQLKDAVEVEQNAELEAAAIKSEGQVDNGSSKQQTANN